MGVHAVTSWTVHDARLAPSSDTDLALEAVRSVPPADDAMEAHRDVLAYLIGTQPDIARRSCRPGHLTGSACVIDPVRGAMVVLLHTKLGKWLQPGGHADGDTNLAGVAIREATEETGIDGLAVDPVPVDVDIHRVSPPDDTPHLHLDVRFLVLAPAGALVTINHESRDFRWVGLDDLDVIGADPSLRRMADAGFARAADHPSQTSPGV